jgi:hypothetical protein
MPRILAACLAVFLTANGWVALPSSHSPRSSRAAYAMRIAGVRPHHEQPAAFPESSALDVTQQQPEPIAEAIGEYRSRPIDPPPAFRLRQRPPPQGV